MNKQLHDTMAGIAHWPRTLRLLWSAAPFHVTIWGLLLLVQGVLPAATIYLTKLLVDNLVAAMNSGWEQVGPTLTVLALIAAALLASDVLHSVSDWVRTAQSEFVQDYIRSLVHRQSGALDLSFYESSDYHDRLDQVRSDAASRPVALLENMGALLQSGITLLAMAAILVPYGPLLPVLLLLSTLPALGVVLIFDRRYHRWWEQTTANRRRAQYYDALLTDSWSAPEVRLFGLASHFQSAYQSIRHRLRHERLKQLREQSAARLIASVAGIVVLAATMGWMVWRVVQGLGTLGDLALFYQAFQRGQGLMRSLLGNLGQVYSNTLFLSNLFTFLDLKAQVSDPPRSLPTPTTLKEHISFHNVTFRYPGIDRAALVDFNLTIPAGKIVAIVGPNGAGKSTLVKLLCRFYDPEAGHIELDGLDIRDVKAKELRRLMTGLFQFPVTYQLPARENIGLGDLEAAREPGAIETAATQAGVHDVISRLPHGYETQLGKWFVDGAELSGGEWQRIATARAFLRRAPIAILDEPTSFMDSWAEADWFERLRALTRGRTALVITHRFTIAMRADVIHVMDAGRIVESGTHEELLAQDGLYAESWHAQMRASSGEAEVLARDR